jgi:DNA-binding transcriptional ArsR family regulator
MADRLSHTFVSLSDPTRRAILRQLGRGERSVTDLAKPFAMSLPAVSKHLRMLERSGLIEQRRQHRWRFYRLKAEPLKEAVEWLDDYRRFWEASMDRLGDYLKELQSNPPSNPQTKGASHAVPEPLPRRKR